MNTSVLDYLENSCKNSGDKTAFVDENSSITFNETKHLALGVSDEIIKSIGFTNNEPILIYLPKSVEAIVSMLGVVYSGNFYTPTSVDFPSQKLLSIVEALTPSLVVTATKHKQKLLDIGVEESKIICYDKVDFTKDTQEFKSAKSSAINTDIVYTYFTSGSTGVPKGVTISHGNILDYIDWVCGKFPIDKDTVFGNQSALYFDITTQDIYATLKQGATMVIIPERLFAFPIKVVEFIKHKEINFLYWVPSAYVNLVNFKALDNVKLNNIKAIMFGGEVMPTKHLNYLIKRLPNLNFVANVYGPTEATVNSTYYILDRDFDENESLPLGGAIENKRVVLFDEEDNPIKIPNQKGELCVFGVSLSSGYYKNPKKTKEVFVQNPLHDDFEDLMYKTGDLAMYDENGLLVFCGRKDNQIKHLGYRIELGEIESAVISLDTIDNCMSFYNEAKRQITLLYLPKDKKTENKDVKLALLGILPKYMVPTKYHKLESIPLNANGKIDRTLLKEKYS